MIYRRPFESHNVDNLYDEDDLNEFVTKIGDTTNFRRINLGQLKYKIMAKLGE